MKRKRSPLIAVVVLLLSLAIPQLVSASANWFVVETRENHPDCECAWAKFRHDDGREVEACCIEKDCGGIIPSIGQEYKEDFSGDGTVLVPTGEDKPPGLQRFKVIEEEPPPPTQEPTSTPTPTDTPTPTPTDTPTPTPTSTPTNTPVPPTDTPPPPPTATPRPGAGWDPFSRPKGFHWGLSLLAIPVYYGALYFVRRRPR